MASNASSSSSIPQKRKGVTESERSIFRKRYKSTLISDLINWFRQETGHKLDQGQVSRILSKKYDYVDDLDKKKDKLALQAQRSSAGEWPELEAALLELAAAYAEEESSDYRGASQATSCEVLERSAAISGEGTA
jgi:hypothetical protein